MMRSTGTAAGLGVVSGLRSMQALAWVSRTLSGMPQRRRTRGLERILANDAVAAFLAMAAAGELAVDKHPSAPDRTRPDALLARAVAGAVVGSVAAGRDREVLGALTGAGSAVVGAYAGWFLRRESARITRLPDTVLAVAEDALAVSLARRLVRGWR
jgi:uncharacterized membrane protein